MTIKEQKIYIEKDLSPSRTIRYFSHEKKRIIEKSFDEFFLLTNITFLSQLAFSSETVCEKIKNHVDEKLKENKISERARKIGVKFKTEIEQGYVEDFYIKRVNSRKGLGLFAHHPISKGAFIGEYLGLVRPCTYFFANINEYCFRYPLYHLGFQIYTIDAEKFCNETSFMNHSNFPNCEAIVALHGSLLHVCIFAKQSIKKDEELTYDYGNNLWKIP